MLRIFLAIGTILASLASASAQSGCPYITQGAILTPGQWQNCWQSKQDALGFSPVRRSGDTMTGRLVIAPAGANTAGINLTPSTAPGSPVDGDIWPTSTALFAKVGGTTYQLSIPPSRVFLVKTGVNFNATGDNAIPTWLPPGFTRFRVNAVMISNASHSLTTATAGVFTQSGGGGVAVVTAASSITVANSTDATNNNMMGMTVNNSATTSYTLSGQTNLYFRIGTAEGAAATADVTIELTALP